MLIRYESYIAFSPLHSCKEANHVGLYGKYAPGSAHIDVGYKLLGVMVNGFEEEDPWMRDVGYLVLFLLGRRDIMADVLHDRLKVPILRLLAAALEIKITTTLSGSDPETYEKGGVPAFDMACEDGTWQSVTFEKTFVKVGEFPSMYDLVHRLVARARKPKRGGECLKNVNNEQHLEKLADVNTQDLKNKMKFTAPTTLRELRN